MAWPLPVRPAHHRKGHTNRATRHDRPNQFLFRSLSRSTAPSGQGIHSTSGRERGPGQPGRSRGLRPAAGRRGSPRPRRVRPPGRAAHRQRTVARARTSTIPSGSRTFVGIQIPYRARAMVRTEAVGYQPRTARLTSTSRSATSPAAGTAHPSRSTSTTRHTRTLSVRKQHCTRRAAPSPDCTRTTTIGSACDEPRSASKRIATSSPQQSPRRTRTARDRPGVHRAGARALRAAGAPLGSGRARRNWPRSTGRVPHPRDPSHRGRHPQTRSRCARVLPSVT